MSKIRNRALNKFEFLINKTRLHSYPAVLDLVVTHQCNFKCIFCKNYPLEGDKFLSSDNFNSIANQVFPKISNLNICSGGEPLLHKNIIDFLRLAKKYKIKTFLLTNGSLLNKDISKQIVEEELLDTLGLSFDGIRPETVEQIRINANSEQIIDNIKYFLSLRKNNNAPKVLIRSVLMRKTIDELSESIKFWGETGVDILEYSYLSLTKNIDKNESLIYHQDLTKEYSKPDLKTLILPVDESSVFVSIFSSIIGSWIISFFTAVSLITSFFSTGLSIGLIDLRFKKKFSSIALSSEVLSKRKGNVSTLYHTLFESTSS